jgi:hypothetical protein
MLSPVRKLGAAPARLALRQHAPGHWAAEA